MAAPSGSKVIETGTEIQLAATGTTGTVTNATVAECTDDDLRTADVDGAEFAIFEFECAAGGFSAAPTENAFILILEQKINSDTEDAPDPTTTYLYDQIGSLPVAPTDTQQRLTTICPINLTGGKYWIYWKDGGAGTASITSGWEMKVTPIYANTAA